jgi:phosphinothricin acetyltransferase
VEDSVFVEPSRTGLGVGRRLLTELLTACTGADLHQMIAVIADTGDPASEALHRACGFTRVGLLAEVGLKHGRWIDTLLMQRGLSEHG